MPIKKPTRLVLPTLLVSVLLLILGSLAAWSLHQSQQESARLLARNTTRVEASDELILIGEELQKALGQFLLTQDRRYLVPIPQLKRQADDWIARADELVQSEKDQNLVNQIRAGYERFMKNLEALVNQPPSAPDDRAAVADLNRRLDREILEPVQQYQQFNREQLMRLTTQHQRLTNRMGLILFVFGGCGALAGLLAGFAVSRGVERQLQESRHAMTQSEQLATLGRVAAALAHELRNPLTSLRIIAQSASHEQDQVLLDVTDFAILEQEIKRLDHSIQTFLDYARPPRPEKRLCFVQTLVRQTVSLVERRAAQVDVQIQEQLPDESIEVEADPAQVKQILLNILINALDASPDGGTVTVRSRVVPPSEIPAANGTRAGSRGTVEIEVADTGVGLPTNLGNRIFEAFVSTKETGTGLGLAICKRILEDHGGEIVAENAPSGGAIVTVRLPQIQPQKTPKDSPRATSPA